MQEALSEFNDKKKKKIQTKKKKQTKEKYRGRAIFGDRFKFLYPIGKQWRKSMR